MGEVYHARDTRLGRDVALKILPAAVALDADRLARFEREARVLASLNHPNIAQIYGVEETGGTRALVMELVTGDGLDQIVARGAIPFAEALPIARQIAEALEAAHEAGVVHRDLKPANVKVRHDGTVKVLDFGLAKAAGPDPGGGDCAMSSASEDSPTIVSPTQAGIILGTATYMSPEQARGKVVDRRTDIWAFGALLYEMLTGQRLFEGETVSDVIAAILREDIDLSALPPEMPDSIRRLLGRCLDRDVKKRLQAIGEARLVLEEAMDEPGFRVARPMRARTAPVGGVPIATASGRPSRRRLWSPWAAVGLAVALAIGAAAFLFGIRYRMGEGTSGRAPGSLGDRSIAVLPFINSGGSPDDEYFADGMTDELIAALGKVPGLRVAARSSAFTFKGKKLEARDVARQLGVETVLEGTVRRSGQRLRVTASLVSASDGLQIWSSNLENDGGDPFAVQDEVTRAVVSGLSLQLGGTALRASQAGRTKDAEAHDLYLRGLASANPASEADLRRALELYQQALARDPDFALPYAGIAWVQVFLADGYAAPNEAYPKARTAALAALDRDSLLADAHALLAYSTMALDWTFPATIEDEFRRARELDPNSSNTRALLAMYRACQRRTDDALQEADRAERLDPLSAVAPFVREWCNFVAQRWRAVIEAHQRTEAIDPSFVYIESWVGGAYRELGDYDSALREYQKAEKLLGGTPQCGLALTYARMGRAQDARDTMKKVDDYAAKHYISPAMRAVVHGALGDRETAVALLQVAFDKKDLYLLAARPMPELESLLSDPRARSIIGQVDAMGRTN